MMFNRLNFKNTIFIFLLSISCFFSVSIQAETKEEQARNIITSSQDINNLISFYESIGIKKEPSIVVSGINATIIPRTRFKVGERFIDDSYFSILSKISSSYYKKPYPLSSYESLGTFIVLNEEGKVVYIYMEPSSNDEIKKISEFEYLIGVTFGNVNYDKLDLKELINITELSILNSSVDTVILPKENKIEVLYTDYSSIKNIENLDYLKYLDSLNIYNSKLESIVKLENSINLKSLYFNSNKNGTITRFPDLSLFPKLEYLHFFSEEVKGIKSIDTLSNLKVLSTGQSFNYSDVSFPKSLEYLSTGGKVNSSFPDLDNNTNLKELIIVNTNSSDMNDLNLPSNLEKLTLAYNKINKIEGIDGLEKLKEVNLSGNNIEKVEGLDGLEIIEYLKLDKNKITKVEGLKNLSGVKGISFEHNPIETLDFSEIEHLKNTKVLMWYTPFWKTATKEDKRKLR